MARELTPEQKAQRAAKMREARAAKKAEQAAEAKSTAQESAPAADVVAALQAQIAALQAQLMQQSAAAQNDEKVVLRWQAEVADDNQAIFGDHGQFGRVTGKSGRLSIRKADWSAFYTESVRWFIDNRWLIVLSGLDEDERETYHCNYRDGEVLDEKTFRKLVEQGDGLLDIFPDLCVSNQEFAARRCLEAWEQGKITRADRARIEALNEISKKAYAGLAADDIRRKGAFWPILDGMNRAE